MSDDFDFEPVRGLPAKLPPGETLLWQGAPDWKVLARRVFKVQLLSIYFGVLIAWLIVTAIYDGQPVADTVNSLIWVSGLVAACIGILCLLAWGTARTTVYTITNKRVVMRYGIALSMALNLPFKLIDSAGLRSYPSGHGDIPLSLQKGEKISYLILWPHARPWHMKKPEPMLRGIPDAAEVAQILARALAMWASDPSSRESATQDAPAETIQSRRQPEDAPDVRNAPPHADAKVA